MDDRGSDRQLSGQEAELIEYRSVSPMAIICVGLGLFSAVALFGPGLWIVPVVSIVVSLYTYRMITRAESDVSGRGAVIFGMLLAALFLTCAPARYYSRQIWLVGLARRHADHWIDLVREGKLKEAHQLHLPQHGRITDINQLEVHYENPNARQEFIEFVDREPISSLAASGIGGSVDYTGLEESRGAGGIAESFTLGYRIRLQAGSDDLVTPMLIVIYRRSDPYSHDFRWNVEQVVVDER